MIYRALEYLGVPNYLNGTVMGGRVPAKININTMTEPEILQALVDAYSAAAQYPGYNFTAADVQNLYAALLASRTPGGVPGQNDKPFRSLATGWIASATADTQYPQGSGIK